MTREMSCARECSLDQIDGARIVFSKKNNENNKCWKRISTKKGMIADQRVNDFFFFFFGGLQGIFFIFFGVFCSGS